MVDFDRTDAVEENEESEGREYTLLKFVILDAEREAEVSGAQARDSELFEVRCAVVEGYVFWDASDMTEGEEHIDGNVGDWIAVAREGS